MILSARVHYFRKSRDIKHRSKSLQMYASDLNEMLIRCRNAMQFVE